MVKEVELALVKRQLYEAKELIADLQEDNDKKQKRIIALEAVRNFHPATPSRDRDEGKSRHYGKHSQPDRGW